VLKLKVVDSREAELATASLLHSMSAYLSFEGSLADSEGLQERCLSIRTRLLGAEHCLTLTSMTSLYVVHMRQGRWEDAERLGLQVMRTHTRKLGANHPDTLMSMNNVAYTWKSMGKSTEAIDLLRTCVRLRLQQLGPNHQHTQMAVSTLNDWTKGRQGSSGVSERLGRLPRLLESKIGRLRKRTW
jgi:hypothetical protein